MNRRTARPLALVPALLLVAHAGAGDATEACDATPTPIPDDATPVLIHLDLGPPGGTLVERIELGLEIAHPWVGDLRVVLAAPDGTSAVILDRPGLADPPGFAFPGPHGCGGADADAVFADDAADAAQDACSPGAAPVLAGPLRPAEPLGVFAGLPASGVWTLTVTDLGPADAGDLLGVCLRVETAPSCPADVNGDGVLNFFDLSGFLALFNAEDPAADLAAPFGAFNFFDVSAYLDLYNAGCP